MDRKIIVEKDGSGYVAYFTRGDGYATAQTANEAVGLLVQTKKARLGLEIETPPTP